MVSSHLEKIFYHYIIQNINYVNVTKPRFFETELIRELFKIAQEFHNKYNESPTLQQITELIRVKGYEEKITADKLNLIYDVTLSTYDEDWLRENVEAWIEYKNLDTSVFDLINYLKTTQVSTDNIKSIVSTAKSLILDNNSLDFKFDAGLDFWNPDSHEQPLSDTFPTGYPYLDQVTGGGYSIKTLWVFLGEAKIGKSIWLANMAVNSAKLGYNTAYISLEMRDRKVVKRLGANMLGIKMSDYAVVARDKVALKNKLHNVGYDQLTIPGKLTIKEYPTSTASVPDIENYLKRMEEINGCKYKTVFIDYINIMKNWRNPNSENLYMKIKQIAEDLRAMASRNEWQVVTATQVNRSGFGSTDLNYQNVSESAALLHTIDAMFGIIQDVIMHANNEYILKLMANRDDGYKNTKRKFMINYEYMRITEDLDSEMWQED